MNHTSYDMLFKNLKIVDGTGAPAYYGNIGVRDGFLADIGPTRWSSPRQFDCEGLIAVPGFIDIHNHSDVGIFQFPQAKNFTSQGVTTLVVGNCGMSAAPFNEVGSLIGISKENLACNPARWDTFAAYVADLEKLKKAVNIATYVGHNNLRSIVIGIKDKKAEPREMEQMRQLVKEAMQAGAFGLSSGLIYDPGIYADTKELTELCKTVAEYGGIYSTHMRNESDLLIDSVMESIIIGRNSGARVEISHIKTSGKRNFGLAKTVLDLMEYYRRFGVEVTGDTYPCIFGHTGLQNCFPAWTRAAGPAGFLEILKSSEKKNRIKYELARPSVAWENILLDAGFDGTIISGTAKFQEFEGKSIAEISRILKKDPYETIFDLIADDLDIAVLVGGLGPQDMEYALTHDLCMVCSDAAVLEFGQGMCHPRNYRAFTKVLSTYVRQEKLLTMEQAIRKMSCLPAWKLGLSDRGLLKPGLRADMAIFDPWALNYTSDYGDPHHYSTGMAYVLVNGRPVISEGDFTEEMPGAVLRKSG